MSCSSCRYEYPYRTVICSLACTPPQQAVLSQQRRPIRQAAATGSPTHVGEMQHTIPVPAPKMALDDLKIDLSLTRYSACRYRLTRSPLTARSDWPFAIRLRIPMIWVLLNRLLHIVSGTDLPQLRTDPTLAGVQYLVTTIFSPIVVLPHHIVSCWRHTCRPREMTGLPRSS